jgi:hypothetical protein
MYIVNIESCFSKCFFDEVLAEAEGYDEHVQGLTIHQLGMVNGISAHLSFTNQTSSHLIMRLSPI